MRLARTNPPSSTLRHERMTRQRAASTTLNEQRGSRLRALSPEVTQDVETDPDELVMDTNSTKPAKKRLSSQRTNQSLSAKATLKEVMILSPPVKIPCNHVRSIPPSQSPSSDDSALSSVRGQSSEYDTPGTSTAVTPAESLGRRGSLTGISRKAGRGRPMGKLARIGIQNKRKHEDILGDALLAQALQEEEYGEDKPTRGLAKRRKFVAVEDLEGEDLSLSDVDDLDPVEAGHHSAKKMKIGGRLSLPTRTARASAVKSMTNNIPGEIMDTDSDDSGLSEYNSDDDLEDFEGFDASDDETSTFGFTAPGEADTATVASNRSAARSTVRRRGRRMASPTFVGRNRHLRRMPHDSRVSILHPLGQGFQQLKSFRPSASVGNLKLLILRLRLCGIH